MTTEIENKLLDILGDDWQAQPQKSEKNTMPNTSRIEK